MRRCGWVGKEEKGVTGMCSGVCLLLASVYERVYVCVLVGDEVGVMVCLRVSVCLYPRPVGRYLNNDPQNEGI